MSDDNGNGIVGLISKMKEKKDWVGEVETLEQLIVGLGNAGKVVSTREVSRLINKSKSWVGISVVLIRGLKLYPEIKKCHNRNQAYTFLQKKSKMRKWLES